MRGPVAELTSSDSDRPIDEGGMRPRPLASGTTLSPRTPSTRLERWLVQRLLQSVGNPPVEVRLWDGVRFAPPTAEEGESRPAGVIHIRSRSALWRLLAEPQYQFCTGYCDGRIEVEGDLVNVLVALCVGLREREAEQPGVRPRRAFWRPRHGSSLKAARKNIARHYDLGTDFYRLWLDEQLVYTCAYFPTPGLSLEAAQIAKLDHVCRKLRLQPGEEVIEAGCGWGALALHMARKYGVRVRAFNISKDQMAEARRRAHAEGLSDRVEFIEDDWRNITGRCDAFVSVGMLEHVGLKNYALLGDVIHRCLSPRGRGLIHTIGMNAPRPLDAWTEQHIFPGAQPPALSQMAPIFEPHQFSLLDVENLRLHYAQTLRHWLERYERHVETVRRRFDDHFVRMWRFYLASSVAAFETGSLQLFQVLFAPGASNDVPRTRAYQYLDASTGA